MLNVLFVKENVLTVSIISLIIGEMEKVVVTFWEMKNSVFRFLKGYTTNTIRTHFDTKFAPRWKNHKRFPVEIKSFMGFCFRSARGRGHCQEDAGWPVIPSLSERTACPLLAGRVSRLL